MRLLAIGALAVVLGACVSTGNPEHPVRAWTLHEWAFGHEKYTPEEKAYARCLYRNKLPDGSRTGFRRACRIKATQFPMGINAAVYGKLCVMEECHKIAEEYAAMTTLKESPETPTISPPVKKVSKREDKRPDYSSGEGIGPTPQRMQMHWIATGEPPP